MMWLKFLIVFCGGFVTHQGKRTIDKFFDAPYSNLVSYAVGYLAIQPAVLLFAEEMPALDCQRRHIFANLLAAIPFGLGVVLGYVLGAGHGEN